MTDTYTLLQNLVNATEAVTLATDACRWAEKRSRVAEITNRDAFEIACTLFMPYPDEVEAAHEVQRKAYAKQSDAWSVETSAYAAAKAYVEGRELAAFAAVFAPTGELFGDEA